MTALEQIQARKAEAGDNYTRATDTKRAAEAAEKEALTALSQAVGEANDAEEWLALPKAARRRVYAAKPEDVAAFGARHAYGPVETRWTEMGWRKQQVDRSGWRTEYRHVDTPTGTAARILHRRGREWCESLEVTNG